MPGSSTRLLARLEALRHDYGRPQVAAEKVDLLRRLAAVSLPTAEAVLRLHEAVSFLRAYPDDRRVLQHSERLLGAFDRRDDLRRHRAELADTGIAGTPIYYRFIWQTARWLARRWPDRLRVHWHGFERADRLPRILDVLLPYSESLAVDSVELSARQWLETLKAPSETDAAFLVRRFERLGAEPRVRLRLYDELEMPLLLRPGPGTPNRTVARARGFAVAFQTRPPGRGRPALKKAIERRPRSVESVDRRRGRELIDLARVSMVTRDRDLYAFASADANDVRIVSWEEGLAFVAIGLAPEHRLLLETCYGLLMVKNGVPIGYALASSLFGSTEVAFNTFDTFRGVESARVFARLLATVRRLLGSDVFAVEPYQLGHDNEEGLRSGAWWFYYKLGFRSHDPEVRRLAAAERERIRADPTHRSSRATLQRLSADYLFLYLGRPRRGVLGRVWLGDIGLRVSDYLGERFGADREGGIATCAREAAELLGAGSPSGWSRDRRRAWERWAPLVLALPGIEGWRAAEKRALVRVVRAKGGRRESDFARLFDRHARLRRALLRLAG